MKDRRLGHAQPHAERRYGNRPVTNIQAGRVTGRVDGVLTLWWRQARRRAAALRGYFGLTPDDGKLIGFARGLTESDRLGYATYMSADRRANRPGACR